MTTDTPAAAPITAEREAPYTVVFRGLTANERQALNAHPRAEVMSYSHAIHDRDEARAALSAPVAAQPAASGVDALWVDERLSLFAAAEALEVAAEDSDSIGHNSRAMGLRAHAFALREFADSLRTYLSTALTGAAKDVK